MEASSNDTRRTSLNRSNPNSVSDLLRTVSIGDVIGQKTLQARRKIDMDALGADVGSLATLDALVLPDGAKASSILRAFARAGTAGTGEMTVAAKDATPVSGEIAVAPNGNIVTLAADAITELDVQYFAESDVDVVESVFPVASDAITLPASITDKGAVALLEAEAVEGTATGNKIVLTAGGAPAAGQASLNVAGTEVDFAAADAVTRARVKLLVARADAAQLQTLLEAAATTV